MSVPEPKPGMIVMERATSAQISIFYGKPNTERFQLYQILDGLDAQHYGLDAQHFSYRIIYRTWEPAWKPENPNNDRVYMGLREPFIDNDYWTYDVLSVKEAVAYCL